MSKAWDGLCSVLYAAYEEVKKHLKPFLSPFIWGFVIFGWGVIFYHLLHLL